MVASRSLALVSLVLLAGAAQACVLPPRGCTKDKCKRYNDMRIPGPGNWSDPAMWVEPYSQLAFVRSAFNKKISINGPSGLDVAANWLNLYNKYPGWGEDKLPSLNYEYYQYTAPSKGFAPAAKGHGNIQTCCDECRVTDKCAMYMYIPKQTGNGYTPGAPVAGGQCWMVETGGSKLDGPFDWADASKWKTTKPTVNIGSPTPLTRTQMATLFNAKKYEDNGYVLAFLGGYCNQHAGVVDDPHFTGAHGTRFDFNGELNKAFCLVTDRSLHINAVLKGYKSDNAVGASVGQDGKAIRSWIKEVGLVWADAQGQKHSLHLVARAGKETARGAGFLAAATLDGAPVPVPQEAGASFQAADLTLTFVGTAKKGWYDLDKFQVVIGEQLDMPFSMRVAHPKLQSPEDAEVHFNLMFNDIKVTPQVHGVLGQTYRNTPSQLMKAVKYSELSALLGAPVKADGASGAGFLEGEVVDYEASDVLKTDCKVSAFAQ